MDVNDIGVTLLRSIFAGLPFGAALALGIMLPVFVIGVATVTSRFSATSRALVVIGAVVMGSTLSVAFSGRVLYSDSELFRNPSLAMLADGQSSLGARISQIFTLIALLLSFAEIYRCLTRRYNPLSQVARLWWSLLLFNVVSVGMAGIVGEFREPELKFLYFIIIFSGLATMASDLGVTLWRGIRWLLLIPALGSLLCIFIAPEIVLLNDYDSFIPGMKSRLFGLSDHANGIGIVAATALIIEFSAFVRRRPSVIVVSLHLAVLILSQSKTAWLALFAILLVVRWDWITSSNFATDQWRRKGWVLVSAIAATVVLSILGIIASSSTAFERALEAKSVFSLTGRVRIWEITLAEFVNSPLFGYGPSIWDPMYRIAHGIPTAGQAHNQFIHILGQAGIFGLLSMLVYLAVLCRLALRARAIDGGLTLALLLLILIRCITESPLRLAGIMGWENFLHLLILVGAASFGANAPVSSISGTLNLNWQRASSRHAKQLFDSSSARL